MIVWELIVKCFNNGWVDMSADHPGSCSAGFYAEQIDDESGKVYASEDDVFDIMKSLGKNLIRSKKLGPMVTAKEVAEETRRG